MHSINFYNFEETGKGSSKKSTGKTKSCTKRILLFCKLNDAPVVTLNDAVTV